MGFDLTESELKATRKLHGLDKEKNIEEDIEKIKQLNNLLKFFRTHGWIPDMSRELNKNETIEAIEHILSEREQDKKKIKELEEENRIYVLNGNNVKLELYIKENYIPKQKVKDLLIEIQKEYEKLDKASDEFLRNKEKTVEDYVLEKERLTTMQTLAYCRDNLEELSEDK